MSIKYFEYSMCYSTGRSNLLKVEHLMNQDKTGMKGRKERKVVCLLLGSTNKLYNLTFVRALVFKAPFKYDFFIAEPKNHKP